MKDFYEVLEWDVFCRVSQCYVAQGDASTVEEAKAQADAVMAADSTDRLEASVSHEKYSLGVDGQPNKCLINELWSKHKHEEWIKED